MSYLTAHRYGLTHVEPSIAEAEGGWKQVWEHPSGLRAARNPFTGNWHISNGYEIVGGGYSFSSSLRACALRIERLAESARGLGPSQTFEGRKTG